MEIIWEWCSNWFKIAFARVDELKISFHFEKGVLTIRIVQCLPHRLVTSWKNRFSKRPFFNWIIKDLKKWNNTFCTGESYCRYHMGFPNAASIEFSFRSINPRRLSFSILFCNDTWLKFEFKIFYCCDKRKLAVFTQVFFAMIWLFFSMLISFSKTSRKDFWSFLVRLM